RTKAGRVSRWFKTKESRLQNTYHRGTSAYSSRDSRTEAVCARMSLLRIITRFAWMSDAGPHRTDCWTMDSTLLAGNGSLSLPGSSSKPANRGCFRHQISTTRADEVGCFECSAVQQVLRLNC